MSREFAGDTQTQTGAAVGTATPTGNVGVDMTAYLTTARTKAWIVSITVDAVTDVTMWGALAAGVADDSTDDVWGTHQDRHGAYADGKVGNALAIGTHHRIVDDLGVYSRVAFTKSNGAANVTVKLTEIVETHRGG